MNVTLVEKTKEACQINKAELTSQTKKNNLWSCDGREWRALGLRMVKTYESKAAQRGSYSPNNKFIIGQSTFESQSRRRDGVRKHWKKQASQGEWRKTRKTPWTWKWFIKRFHNSRQANHREKLDWIQKERLTQDICFKWARQHHSQNLMQQQ